MSLRSAVLGVLPLALAAAAGAALAPSGATPAEVAGTARLLREAAARFAAVPHESEVTYDRTWPGGAVELRLAVRTGDPAGVRIELRAVRGQHEAHAFGEELDVLRGLAVRSATLGGRFTLVRDPERAARAYTLTSCGPVTAAGRSARRFRLLARAEGRGGIEWDLDDATGLVLARRTLAADGTDRGGWRVTALHVPPGPEPATPAFPLPARDAARPAETTAAPGEPALVPAWIPPGFALERTWRHACGEGTLAGRAYTDGVGRIVCLDWPAGAEPGKVLARTARERSGEDVARVVAAASPELWGMAEALLARFLGDTSRGRGGRHAARGAGVRATVDGREVRCFGDVTTAELERMAASLAPVGPAGAGH